MSSPIDSLAGTQSVVLAGRPATEVRVGGFTVTVESGPDRDLTATLSSTSLTIGTAPTCDLRLTDPGTSRRHALLTLTPAGVRVEDMRSKNGTWIGGARVQSADLPDGGLLQIGTSTLRLRSTPGRFIVFPAGEDSFLGLTGRSRAMRDVFALIGQLARTDLPVSVTGETGTGKELVARALHAAGPRHKKSFLVLDCGAVVEDLLRSEIFGHERGAFTGADQVRKGILEESAGGTVFLDEIGEMRLSIQPHLLRALETREICRIGSHQRIPVDFRVVSATHRDLRALVDEGRFRPDLYYRLSCVTIRLPPLRERREDIPLMAGSFLSACAARMGLAVPRITREAMDVLESHDWPGNVRELRNVVEAACAVCEGNPILPTHVEPAIVAPSPRAAPVAAAPLAKPAPERPVTLEETEKAAILAALEATGWNRKAAARRLCISATTMFAKIRRYGLKPPDSDGG